MAQNNPFAKLGSLDQKLYNDTASKTPEKTIENASMPASQHSGKTQVPSNTTATEKVTYRFHSEGKYAVEDMKTILVTRQL
jgi:hypothetical protein